jgi:hypothetical protein
MVMDIEIKGDTSISNVIFNNKVNLFVSTKEARVIFINCILMKGYSPVTQEISELIRDRTKKIKNLADKEFTAYQISEILELFEKWEKL